MKVVGTLFVLQPPTNIVFLGGCRQICVGIYSDLLYFLIDSANKFYLTKFK